MSNVYQTPESSLLNTKLSSGDYGSLEKAITGDYEFSIGSVLSEAWEKTYGVKWQFQLAFLYYFLTILAVVIVLGIAIAGLMALSQDPAMEGLMQVISQLGINLVMMPIIMGITIMGIKRSVSSPISAGLVFSCFSKTLPLFATLVLMYILIFIGFILLIVPGIYLMIAYFMAMPLVVEKNMGPWQAMETSRKAITHRWFSIFGIFFIMGIILVISAIPLGIGLIWSIPMLYIIIGITYRNMFGIEAETLAQ